MLYTIIGGAGLLNCINLSLCKNPTLSVLMGLPLCGAFIASLVWFIWGFTIRYDKAGKACSVYLIKDKKLFDWYYGIIFTLIGLVCVGACCAICLVSRNKGPANFR